ncbi:MAG: methionyl-tRNA formyltransferase [Planctomycetota bacterium]|jgi:methionyl-tRNA formyltransferase
MRIVFVGTSALGIPSLKILAKRTSHEIKVITKPDQTGGRRGKSIASPLKLAAEELGFAIQEPDKINDPESLDWLREYGPDVMVVASFWAKLSEALLEIPRFGGINIHPSLLPRYRGAAPIQYTLLNGDAMTGVTIFQIRSKMDAGEILGQVETNVEPADNYLTLHDRLAEAAAPLLISVLEALESGEADPRIQDESKVLLAPKISKEQGGIDWNRSAPEIERQVRAFNPWPGAFTFFPIRSKPMRINITEAAVVESDPRCAKGRAGEIVESRGCIKVCCQGGGCLEIARIQREGKKEMSAEEFLRGVKMNPGDRFIDSK